MKTSPLLVWFVWITLIALTATTLYAQTVAATSIIDKMKAAARTSFTLSADLNPGQTGFESAPIAGKKTGNMLTAGEWNRMLELISQGTVGGSTGGVGLYKCTNAQSLDTTNNPCYGASRNGGAGTNQYRVLSCTDNDGVRSYTMSSILNFGELVANKWAVSVNGGTIECDDGTVLVIDMQSSNISGLPGTQDNLAYINPDNTGFATLACTPGVNYMINPIAFSAESASSFTTRKVAVLGAGNWQVKGTGFVRIRNKDSDLAQALRVSSVLDGTTTHLLDNSADAGMYANSFLDPVSVPAGKTTELRVSVKNNTLHWGNIVVWCN